MTVEIRRGYVRLVWGTSPKQRSCKEPAAIAPGYLVDSFLEPEPDRSKALPQIDIYVRLGAKLQAHGSLPQEASESAQP